jgi:O-6-methylguanine DNA methyltransferase
MIDLSAERRAVTVGLAETPLGAFRAVFTPSGLAHLAFPTESSSIVDGWVRRWMPDARIVRQSPDLVFLSEQLTAYLQGSLRVFSIPLDLRGTPFQLQVWNALLDIGYGEVRSYGDMARAIGRPRAVRAVGAANGANPVAIIVPCHRVIGSDGTLTGYGGGLQMKEYLLRLEGSILPIAAS